MASVKVKYQKINGGMDAYKRVQVENLKNARKATADLINNRAKMLAPYDNNKTAAESHLKYNGRVLHSGNYSEVVYGDSKIPYARIHELGGWTGRGYRTFIVPKHYLERAAQSVLKEGGVKKFLK